MVRLIPTYETGIAVPPEFRCVCGKNCTNIDKHHNAFDKPYYKKTPGIRKESSQEILKLFRGSRYNTFWLPRCTHISIQVTGAERVRKPRLEIAARFIEEAQILLKLDATKESKFASGKNIEWLLGKGISHSEIDYKIAELQAKREVALREVASITVIPEEVVTSALLYSVPEIARQRLLANPGQSIVAPARWPINRVQELAKTGREIRQEAAATMQDKLIAA